MSNTNEIFETIVDTQKKSIESLVDATSKIQEALKSGNAVEKTTELYQDWWNKQLSLLNNVTSQTKVEVENTQAKTEDYYKKGYETQIDAIKKASDFNLNFFNTLSNFGKKSTDAKDQLQATYSQWNTLFESWTKSLNTTFESLNTSYPKAFSPELFQNTMNTNTLFLKLQNFYQPYFNAVKGGNFSADSMKTLFDPAQYKKITEETFSNFFQGQNLNTLIETNTKSIHDFFQKQQNTTKEYKEFWNVFTEKFPTIISADYTKFNDSFKNINGSYKDLFEPALKLISNAKDKENIELAVESLDKSTTYSIKLAQIQYLLNKTGENVAEEVGKLIVEKSKKLELTNSFQTFFNDWVAINEKHYTKLYATKEFSKLKAELTTLSLDVKKNIEQQFENKIEHLPLVVKSELNELYQTIHDLKKTIKALESKVNTTAKTTATKTTATTTAARTATTVATAAAATVAATATAKKATV